MGECLFWTLRQPMNYRIVNSYFKIREEHLVTFKSGSARTQINYFLVRANSRRWCRDCKVLPSECLTMQHRLLVLDMEIRGAIRKQRKVGVYKVKWWNLKGENACLLYTSPSPRD